MDLTDNEVPKLENFPLMKRLKTLLLSNNRISRIADGLGASIPNLQHLILTNNRITSLGEIEALGSLSKLTTLSLLGNPVTRKQNYRYYTIFKNPGLTVLDFQRVRRKERIGAAKLFASKAGRAFAEEVIRTRYQTGADAAASAAAGGSSSSSSSSGAGAGSSAAAPAFTPEQLTAIQAAIAAASTREEIEELESYLRKGQLPPSLAACGSGGSSSSSAADETNGSSSSSNSSSDGATAAAGGEAPGGRDEGDTSMETS